MQYDPIQGQGHEPFKVGNRVIFKCYLLRDLQWEQTADLILKLGHNILIWSGQIFRSTPPSQPNTVGIKCPPVRPSVRKKFLQFQWNWYVGRGRWVMHDSMQYARNSAIFEGYLLPQL